MLRCDSLFAPLADPTWPNSGKTSAPLPVTLIADAPAIDAAATADDEAVEPEARDLQATEDEASAAPLEHEFRRAEAPPSVPGMDEGQVMELIAEIADAASTAVEAVVLDQDPEALDEDVQALAGAIGEAVADAVDQAFVTIISPQ